MNEQNNTRAKPDPFKPPRAELLEPARPTGFRSAGHAFLIGCRNGFFWSIVLGGPMACLLVPTFPRVRSFDANGNVIPFPDEISWLAFFNLAAPFFAFISAIWTVSAGLSLLVTHLRHQHTRLPMAADDDNTMTRRD
ncbi:hypothetical protein [Rhodopirellula baltica]|uniref:hypothetical protein n=1 Tax=Rhodopirellula baltica TaxID=265606 RepID=UPI00056CE6C7|nr:hypothetical protein [Rhodopirellula baltica]